MTASVIQPMSRNCRPASETMRARVAGSKRRAIGTATAARKKTPPPRWPRPGRAGTPRTDTPAPPPVPIARAARWLHLEAGALVDVVAGARLQHVPPGRLGLGELGRLKERHEVLARVPVGVDHVRVAAVDVLIEPRLAVSLHVPHQLDRGGRHRLELCLSLGLDVVAQSK